MGKEKEDQMQTQLVVPALPQSKRKKKRLVQADVDMDLFQTTKKEMDKRGIQINQVVELGLKTLLLNTNKREAQRLGIVPNLPEPEEE